MGNKIGQAEIPNTRVAKRSIKKQRIRKMRAWIKKNADFIPLFNRFTGYS